MRYRWLALCLIGCVAASGVAPALAADPRPGTQWVIGAQVNLRASPSLSATVLMRLPVNAEVILRGERSAGSVFCEVDWIDAMQVAQRGHIACQYLGQAPLAGHPLVTRNADAQTTATPSAQQLFWLLPNVGRLLAVGKRLEESLLTEADRESELALKQQQENGQMPALISRPKVAEFEAMKTHLARGVMGEVGLALTSWAAVKAQAIKLARSVRPRLPPEPAKGSGQPRPAPELADSNAISRAAKLLHVGDWALPIAHHIELPAVLPSFFKSTNELARPSAPAEAVSGQWRIPYRVTTRPGLYWTRGVDNNESHVSGAWDIGQLTVKLDEPVLQHDVRRNGGVTTSRTQLERTWEPHGDDEFQCPDDFAFGESAPHMRAGAGSADGADIAAERAQTSTISPQARLFRFFTIKPLPRGPFKVKTMRHKLDGIAGFVSAQQMHFDIDGDGIFDLVVWEGTGQSQDEIHAPQRLDPHMRMFFVNVNGEWKLLDQDAFTYGCGC